jgi:hypothetical protein
MVTETENPGQLYFIWLKEPCLLLHSILKAAPKFIEIPCNSFQANISKKLAGKELKG